MSLMSFSPFSSSTAIVFCGFQINAALRGLPVDAEEALIAAAARMGAGPPATWFGITPEGVAVAVRRALGDADAGKAPGGGA